MHFTWPKHKSNGNFWQSSPIIFGSERDPTETHICDELLTGVETLDQQSPSPSGLLEYSSPRTGEISAAQRL